MKEIINKFFVAKEKDYIYDFTHSIFLGKNKFDLIFKEREFDTEFSYNIGIELKNKKFEEIKDINIFKENFDEKILNKYINSYISKLYEHSLLSSFVKIESNMHRLFNYNSMYYFLINREIDSYIKVNFKKPFNKKYNSLDKFFELNQIDISCSSFFCVNEDKSYKPFFNLKLNFINHIFDFNIVANEFNQTNFEEFEILLNKKCLQQKYFTIKKSIIKDLEFSEYLGSYKKYDSLLVMNDY